MDVERKGGENADMMAWMSDKTNEMKTKGGRLKRPRKREENHGFRLAIVELMSPITRVENPPTLKKFPIQVSQAK
jgi:hypothetical protein